MSTLLINKNKLLSNIYSVKEYLYKQGISLHLVFKAIEHIDFFYELVSEIQAIPISITNIGVGKILYKKSRRKLNLITIPKAKDLLNLIRYFSSSYHSDIKTLLCLYELCAKEKKQHNFSLIIDMGEGREGVSPNKIENIIEQCEGFNSKYLKFNGFAANFGCQSDLESAKKLLLKSEDAFNSILEKNYLNKSSLSLGGSIFLEWIQHNKISKSITELRIGEAIFLNNIPHYNTSCYFLHDDVFLFSGEILDIKQDQDFNRVRLLLDFGKIHTKPEALLPENRNIYYINHSSNYSVYGMEGKKCSLKVGDKIYFKLTYDALLQCSISPCVNYKLLR